MTLVPRWDLGETWFVLTRGSWPRGGMWMFFGSTGEEDQL
jgi:hypothetical protein